MNIEEDDPCATLASHASRLGAVHLSDSNRLPPGEGHLDFGAVGDALVQGGFTGRLSVECRLRDPAEIAMPRCAAFLNELHAESLEC